MRFGHYRVFCFESGDSMVLHSFSRLINIAYMLPAYSFLLDDMRGVVAAECLMPGRFG